MRRAFPGLTSSLASACLHPSAAFSSTGFDRLSSPVFCPLNPEGSIEDCLAALGDRVAKDLGSRLATAVHTLLSRSARVEPCGAVWGHMTTLRD